MKKALILLAACGLAAVSQAADEYQKLNERLLEPLPRPVDYSVRREVRVPTRPGLQTLRCDFHIHTTNSDGKVSAEFRVREAWHDGLDVMALSDHSENRNKLKGNLDQRFEKTRPMAEKQGILLIQAVEIAASNMPPGHMNALFVTNSEATRGEFAEWRKRLDTVVAQGGYVIWNHPGWNAQQKTLKLWPEHRDLIKAGIVRAVEVFNDVEWYPGALDWCAEYNLAPLACTDIHPSIAEHYGTEALRPMTLVFAREASAAAVREALEARQTAGFFAGRLAGIKAVLEPLVPSAVRLQMGEGNRIQIESLTDVPLDLQGTDAAIWAGTMKLAGRGGGVIQLAGPVNNLPVNIRNWHIASEETLKVSLPVVKH